MATTTYTEISSNKWRTVAVMTLFVAAVIGLGYVFGVALNLPWLLPLAIVIAIVQSFSSYWWSDKVALAISGAHEVDKQQAPELYRLVENLSIASGLPMPRVYIVDDPSPNAFATGRNPEHSAIAVTTGLLGKLTKPSWRECSRTSFRMSATTTFCCRASWSYSSGSSCCSQTSSCATPSGSAAADAGTQVVGATAGQVGVILAGSRYRSRATVATVCHAHPARDLASPRTPRRCKRRAADPKPRRAGRRSREDHGRSSFTCAT